jgi:hypothetical protein
MGARAADEIDGEHRHARDRDSTCRTDCSTYGAAMVYLAS